MADTRRYIAVDLGAESGRVILGTVNGSNLQLDEIHRFGNGPIEVDGTLRWDFEKLFSEIKAGISKAVKAADGPVTSIGVDSWGVDFGLLGEDGELLENPYNYRDSRTEKMIEKSFEFMPKRDIYNNTGIQFMQFNTLFQLLAMKLSSSEVLKKAKKLIFMADLVSYHLCGQPFAEYSLASTTQLMDMKTSKWSEAIFDKMSLPIDIMPEVVSPGTVVGKLKPEIANELGCKQIPVVAVGSHDTASAVAAVPAKGNSWAYLSCGTWSLMGAEIPEARIDDNTFEYGFTNEGGVENTIRLLKNIMGLWLVQESRRQWQQQGVDLDYSQITKLASEAKPFVGFINPNDSRFYSPGDMPARINEYLKETSQQTTDDKGQIVRIILESLALNYRWTLEKIEQIIGSQIDILHMVGGGIQNQLLCQFAANAIGRKVITGPVEGTASGNILMQAKASGQIKSLEQGRQIIASSIELNEYLPQDKQNWDQQYAKIEKIF
ncbi:MAG: rhamnulokinase [Phycisphaerae bacterium]|nr:rhamnulokinase [Phycisphaerae bacterium]